MSWWTEGQDDCLRECSYRGARYVRDEIERRFGVRHTVHAVEMRASRLHVSLMVRTVCPSCGAVGVVIVKGTGMCRRCSDRFHLEEARAFGELLEAERAAAEDPAKLAEIRREWDAQRKRNSRACKKYGLPTQKQWDAT